jgi:hypothetical protein
MAIETLGTPRNQAYQRRPDDAMTKFAAPYRLRFVVEAG